MSQKEYKGFSARIVADSVSPDGVRLTTAELVFPRLILSEFNTHRILSKNSASSRAIPVRKQMEKILDHAYIPDVIGVNKAGMQAAEYLEGENLESARYALSVKRDRSLVGALEDLLGYDAVLDLFGGEARLAHVLLTGFSEPEFKEDFRRGLDLYTELEKKVRAGEPAPAGFINMHKQTVNRYLEPFMWHTVVTSGTEWENLFALRIHGDAQPEINTSISLLRDAMAESTPEELEIGQWHLPFVQEDEKEQAAADPEKWRWISTGRCARTSYETHDGKRDIEKDIELSKVRLEPVGHMSPFEHPATPAQDSQKWSGNFRGWDQFRKMIPNEDNYAEKVAGRQ